MFAYLASIVKLFDNVPSMISKNFAAIYKICENNAALQPATPSMIGGYFFLRYLMYYLRTQPIEIQALYRSTLQTPLQKMSNQLRLEKPEEFNAEKARPQMLNHSMQQKIPLMTIMLPLQTTQLKQIRIKFICYALLSAQR
ncbi:MAG: hypothetical protein HWD59_04850 [Coxiellaceae bacterium]|nr:MAG: hypothetical protein HWD59_04850 [Coxiellaceae bacterium]